jgi:chromosome segregation ATPase
MSRTALEGITKRPSNSTGTRNKEFSMPKNPFEKRCEDLSREIRSLEQKSQELQQILQWYRSTSEPQLITALHTSQRQAEDMRTLLWQCEREIAELSKQLRDVESQLGSWLNPFNWFCPKQQLLREKCANLRSALSKKQKQYGQAKTRLNALEAESSN